MADSTRTTLLAVQFQDYVVGIAMVGEDLGGFALEGIGVVVVVDRVLG